MKKTDWMPGMADKIFDSLPYTIKVVIYSDDDSRKTTKIDVRNVLSVVDAAIPKRPDRVFIEFENTILVARGSYKDISQQINDLREGS